MTKQYNNDFKNRKKKIKKEKEIQNWKKMTLITNTINRCKYDVQ